MRAFAIVDMSQRPSRRKPCATLFYNEDTREYRIEIDPAAGEDDVPMLLIPFIWRKQRTLDATWSRKWVQERIVPPSRQNLGQILKANGLEDYDEFQMLMISKGRCCQDDFALVEIDAESLTHEMNDAAATERQAPCRAPETLSVKTDERPLAEQIGLKLAEARKRAGLSQSELAQRCGLDQSAISRIERGRGNPTVGLIEDIASQLGVRVNLFLD